MSEKIGPHFIIRVVYSIVNKLIEQGENIRGTGGAVTTNGMSNVLGDKLKWQNG